MASLKNKLTLLFLCALVAAAAGQASQGGPHGPQGGPHVSQGAPRSQAIDDEAAQVDGATNADEDGSNGLIQWIPCDSTTTTVLSCHDCNTRLICKPIGGLLRQCRNPFKPHCNNGICSAIPAEGC